MPLGFYPLHHFTATAAATPPLYPFSSTLSSPSLFDSLSPSYCPARLLKNCSSLSSRRSHLHSPFWLKMVKSASELWFHLRRIAQDRSFFLLWTISALFTLPHIDTSSSASLSVISLLLIPFQPSFAPPLLPPSHAPPTRKESFYPVCASIQPFSVSFCPSLRFRPL
jgi:hypothetical protein